MTSVETPRLVVATATANGTLAAGKHTPVDATAGPLTMTLPTGVNPGAHLSVEKTDATSNTVTVSGSIRGTAGTYVVSAQYEKVTFRADPGGSWWPTSAGQPGTSLAATYAALDGSSRLAIGGTELTPAQIGAVSPATAQGIALTQALIFGS